MSFLNPLFLLGLTALAVPILVHLVRRTRAPRIEFPSLMFVRQVPQRTIRRRRLHNLLLMLMRSLALLLLIVAFMRPYFSGGMAEAGARDRANVILLDTSLSMRYGDRFEQARKRARALIDEMRGSEQAALVTFHQAYEIRQPLTTETAKLQAALDAVKPGYDRTDYLQALRGAASLFKDSAATNKRILLVSDFQATGYDATEAQMKLPREIKVTPVDVGEEAAVNLAVTDVGAQPVIYQQKYVDKLRARISNFSDQPKDGVRIELNINDHLVEKREFNLAPRDSEDIEFTGFNLNEGVNRGSIQISDDSFPVDNRFYFTLRRATQLKALVIEAAVRGRSESFYLRNALTTGENLPFALTVKSVGSVNPGELPEYKVVIVNDAGDLSPALTSELGKFVERGGGLILASGPRTQAADFNRAFENLSPAMVGEAVQLRGDFVVLSEIKTDHPIFEVFRQSGRLTTARVSGYHRATPREQSSVLARYEDGSPALIESSRGSGRVLLLTTTLNANWNELPLTPFYLPLVRQMVRHLGEREEKAWHPLGQTFTVPAAEDGTPPAVDSPSGERLTEKRQTVVGDLLLGASEPGFYRLRYNGRTDFAAVDLEAAESDLSKLDVTEFIAAVTGDQAAAQAAAGGEQKLSAEEVESRQRVWWALLIGALLLFVAEAIMARRTRMARLIG